MVMFGLVSAMPSGAPMAQAGKSIAGFDNICLTEARRAEAQHGIPKGLLQSISRVEAGRKTVTGEFMPWAWTLNDRGEGLFFDSREAAMRHLQDAVAAGDHSVDVGCMQVNTKWHMDGFHELGDMLDPVQNADYAAGFLLDLHEAHQSWDDAVKHYHSAEPEKHIVYHRRVLAELERFLNEGAQDVALASAAPADAGHNAVKPDAAQPDTRQSDSGQSDSGQTGSGFSGNLSADLSGELALRSPAMDTAPPVAAMPEAGPERVTPAPMPTGLPVTGHQAGERAMDRQPNLAPHWDRVEHFRRLLAQGAG